MKNCIFRKSCIIQYKALRHMYKKNIVDKDMHYVLRLCIRIIYLILFFLLIICIYCHNQRTIVSILRSIGFHYYTKIKYILINTLKHCQHFLYYLILADFHYNLINLLFNTALKIFMHLYSEILTIHIFLWIEVSAIQN